MRAAEIIADALFEHLPMKRTNPRHPAVMACARDIERAIAKDFANLARSGGVG